MGELEQEETENTLSSFHIMSITPGELSIQDIGQSKQECTFFLEVFLWFLFLALTSTVLYYVQWGPGSETD